MEESLKQELIGYGIDLEMAIYRFLGNEAMYEEFLRDFMEDENYFGLLEAVPQKEYEKAFRHAHTLKGVAANLGIDSVQDDAEQITEALRGKKPEEVDGTALDDWLRRLEQHYAGLREILEKYAV